MMLSKAPHAHESAMLSEFSAAHPTVGSAVADARAAGIPWSTIIGWLVQYGPNFVAFLKTVLDALKTPVP